MSYALLPLKFERLNPTEVFLVNEVGEFVFITDDEFERLISHQLNPHTELFLNLKAKQLLTDTELDTVIEMLSIKYRTKRSFLEDFTALHMVVPTLRCNSNCVYCQVSRKDVNAKNFDMDKATAKKVVDNIFNSPSLVIKIEFQGGEPLLNFKILKYIIEYAEWLNIFKRKNLEFVICTNLTNIDERMLKYLRKHRVYLSTSLDGGKELHNKSRPLQNTVNSYDNVVDKINLCRRYLGHDRISALMTTSSYNLNSLTEVIDEYLKLGFNSIFLRSLNPYGFAKERRMELGYNVDKFINNYIKALNYIIDLNFKGTFFSETFASLLLTKILTPFSTGFVDLQSPAGVAISGVIYNYDGNVYVSDEARMLASMGDNTFLMGNVHKNSYQELFGNKFIRSLIGSSCLECLPVCAECAYQSFCGADPVRNYSEQRDIVGNRAISEVCRKNKAIIKYLLELIRRNDEKINRVLWSWITRRNILQERL